MPQPGLTSKVYTKEELCLLEIVPDPVAIIIFGASGDLTHRKLLPSLFFLMQHDRMPKSFYILGVSRTHMSDEVFRAKAKLDLPEDATEEDEKKFLDRCFYLSREYESPDLYTNLKKKLDELDKKFEISCCHLFYLSTPPSLYLPIIKNLGESGLTPRETIDKGWNRVVIEKPFGHSLESARELNHQIHQYLSEKQIYRIDHYLGKETVQNILMFRFANLIFEPVWNRNYIDHVQITAAETLGVEHRAGYYEQAGVLRDMFQNHLLQLLTLIAMEPPLSLRSEAVRDKKVDVYRSMRIMNLLEAKENSVCAQYSEGRMNGKNVPGYLQEKGVSVQSRIPTFGAVKFELDSWRWQGVPFFLRSGKRLKERRVDIVIRFKCVPASIFKPLERDQLTPNILKFRIQPDESISIQFEAKHPGPKLCLGTVNMDFEYEEAFKTPPPESYVRLFHDAMAGDQSLFSRSDAVELCWQIMDPIIKFWESKDAPPLPAYPSGNWGPKEADILIEKTGRSWL